MWSTSFGTYKYVGPDPPIKEKKAPSEKKEGKPKGLTKPWCSQSCTFWCDATIFTLCVFKELGSTISSRTQNTSFSYEVKEWIYRMNSLDITIIQPINAKLKSPQSSGGLFKSFPMAIIPPKKQAKHESYKAKRRRRWSLQGTRAYFWSSKMTSKLDYQFEHIH